jgi:hypothetical protein
MGQEDTLQVHREVSMPLAEVQEQVVVVVRVNFFRLMEHILLVPVVQVLPSSKSLRHKIR